MPRHSHPYIPGADYTGAAHVGGVGWHIHRIVDRKVDPAHDGHHHVLIARTAGRRTSQPIHLTATVDAGKIGT